MKDVFDEVIRTTLVELGARFRDFVPNLLAMLVLLGSGDPGRGRRSGSRWASC